MQTRLTDMLEVEHPVMLAGMGGVSYADVVAAVSEAGGFGTLGASTMGDSMVAEIRKVKAQTSRPFGVDLLTAIPGQVERQVQAVIDEGARVFVAGLGVPRDVSTTVAGWPPRWRSAPTACGSARGSSRRRRRGA